MVAQTAHEATVKTSSGRYPELSDALMRGDTVQGAITEFRLAVKVPRHNCRKQPLQCAGLNRHEVEDERACAAMLAGVPMGESPIGGDAQVPP